jgi:hypothetical protein
MASKDWRFSPDIVRAIRGAVGTLGRTHGAVARLGTAVDAFEALLVLERQRARSRVMWPPRPR